MNAPPTYRHAVQHAEAERIRQRQAQGKCIACGIVDPVPGSLLCAKHRSKLDEHVMARRANERAKETP